MEASDPLKAADLLLKIASLYSDEPETKEAVFETVGKCSVLHVFLSSLDDYISPNISL